MTLQLKREQNPNDPHTRIYYSHEELAEKNECAPRGTRVRNPVLALVLAVRGVAFATITPYALVVTKAPTWDWEDVEKGIKPILIAFNSDEGRLQEADARAE